MWKVGLIYLDASAVVWLVLIWRLFIPIAGPGSGSLLWPVVLTVAPALVVVASVFAWRQREPWAMATCIVALAIPLAGVALSWRNLLEAVFWLPPWIGAVAAACIILNVVSLVAVTRAGRAG